MLRSLWLGCGHFVDPTVLIRLVLLGRYDLVQVDRVVAPFKQLIFKGVVVFGLLLLLLLVVMQDRELGWLENFG